jgi:hypothetical protein
MGFDPDHGRMSDPIPPLPLKGREDEDPVAWMQRSEIRGDIPDSIAFHPGYGAAME